MNTIVYGIDFELQIDFDEVDQAVATVSSTLTDLFVLQEFLSVKVENVLQWKLTICYTI